MSDASSRAVGPKAAGPMAEDARDRGVARLPRYSAETARAYVEAILARVGDRDPMALLAAAPDALAGAVGGLSEADARRQPDGGWSVLQVLHHLSDCEMVYGYRMRLIVADERPALPGFDQEAWAERLHYDAGPIADVLADLTAQRSRTLRWLAHAPLAPHALRRRAGAGGRPQRAGRGERRPHREAAGRARPRAPGADRAHPRRPRSLVQRHREPDGWVP